MPCHVGAVLPIMTCSGSTKFQLCQNGECIDAAQIKTFGIDNPESVDLLQIAGLGEWKVNSMTHFIAEYEVTDVLIEAGWSPDLDTSLVARLFFGVLQKVPQPCVIIKELQDDNAYVPIIVTFHPEEDIDNYGDLIDSYVDANFTVSSIKLSS